MDAQQELQLIAQMNIAAQFGTCGSTNTRDLSKAYGIEVPKRPQTILFTNSPANLSFWKKAPEAPHHKYMKCPVSDFDNHQIPIGLLAQERDNFIQKKMQLHLRNMRTKQKKGDYTKDEEEKAEFIQHSLQLSSRQRYIRDNFYNSYQTYATGKTMKNNDLKKIFRVPPLTSMERRKAYVIRGISYNDFLWPKGKDFSPETPFSVLPRHIIRNREKEKTPIDLNQSLPVVESVLSESASIIVSQSGFKFYNEMRRKFHLQRQIKQQLEVIQHQQEDQVENAELAYINERCKSLVEDDELFHFFWPSPTFSHKMREISQPRVLQNVELHSYQLKGLSWLVQMYDHHMNALLADEVGLGKTLQLISFFAYLKENRHINGPHLVVVPNAVMVTWKTEFEKYFPSAKLVLYHAKAKHRHNFFQEVVARSDFDILLTTYSIIDKDIGLLSTITWRTAVFDEGHKLKNPKANIFSTVDKNIFSDFRIIVTATPFQNNLEELWAIYSLLRPQEFSNPEKFRLFFNAIEAKNTDEETQNLIIKRLQDVIRPFTLRRNKEEISVEIPGKYEVTIKCSPSQIQVDIMNSMKDKEYPLTKDKVSQKIYISKRVSNSPILFLPRSQLKLVDPEYVYSRSPKLQMLDVIIQRLKTTGHRFLIYSQWTSMMDILESFLHWRSIQISRIDGSVSTAERTRIIQNFVQAGSPIQGMLLSTRSSAFGLNLQSADTVILFDSDYNPFVELQASARVHRIGQTNTVIVIRLMMVGTGEESILRISRRKFRMGQQIIAAGLFNLRSTEEEKENAMHTEIEKVKEVVDPSDEELNSIIARGQEEQNLLSFTQIQKYEPTEKQGYHELVVMIIESYKSLIEGRPKAPATETGQVEHPEDEVDEFEDVD